MDILTHAIVGAATGSTFGRPVLGAVCAVLPDLVLGAQRRAAPTSAYNATHSLFFVLVVGLVAGALENAPSAVYCAVLAALSHIALDLPTHGKDWAPTLFYPFSKRRYSFGEEWEFFNAPWWLGLIISIFWVFICLLTNIPK